MVVLRMPSAAAPIDMRMPISFVRWVIERAITA
jgi:hypothetical protein